VLESDSANGFGPETIALNRLFAGTYRYYVQRYSGVGSLSGSSATVTIYTSAGLIQAFTAPAAGGGDYWIVCDIDGHRRHHARQSNRRRSARSACG
jgi:hypothetical protein